MKKFLAILLACAMFLPILASCGSLQAGELDVEAYAQGENEIQNVAGSTGTTVTGYTGRTEIDTSGGEYDPEKNPTGTYSSCSSRSRKLWALEIEAFYNPDGTEVIDGKTYYVYEVNTAWELATFFKMMEYSNGYGGDDAKYKTNYFNGLTGKWETELEDVIHEDVTATGMNPSHTPDYDFSNVIIRLMRDFDMTGGQASMTTYADGRAYFNGIFDGNGHVVKNRTIEYNSNYLSMFGALMNATVKDVAFVNCTTDGTSGAKNVSGLAIWSAGDVVIDNVYVGTTLKGGTGYVGGVIGEVRGGTITITNSTVDVDITDSSGNNYGGLIGRSATHTTNINIDNCVVTCDMVVANKVTLKDPAIVDVNGDKVADKDAKNKDMYTFNGYTYTWGNCGGLFGEIYTTSPDRVYTISNCIVSGSVVAGGDRVSGVVGICQNNGSSATVCSQFTISNTVSNVNLSATDAAIFVPDGKAYYIKSGENYVAFGEADKAAAVAAGEAAAAETAASKWGGFVGSKLSSGDVVLTNCINNGNITASEKAGGMIGEKGNTSQGRKFQLNNCVNTGTITVTGDYAGGLVAYMTQGPLTVTGGSNSGVIKGVDFVGGGFGALGGSAGNAIVIDGFTNNGTVSGASKVGGVMGSRGMNSKGAANLCALTIKNCINNGSVTATGNEVAGILAYLGGGNNADNTNLTAIQKCTNNGKISGSQYVAGILGRITRVGFSTWDATNKKNVYTYYNTASSVELTDCTNNGVIEALGDNYIAGIVANAGDHKTSSPVAISGCVNTGDLVYAGSRVAGIVGDYVGKGISITNCRNDGDFKPSKYATTCSRWAGSIAGYIHGSADTAIEYVNISGCVNTGDIVGNRSSGGIAGYIQHTKAVTIENCTNASNMDFQIYENSNVYVAGIVGLLCENETIIIKGCVVSGTLSLSDKVKASSVAGGLVGNIRNSQDKADDPSTDKNEAANNTNFEQTTVTISDCIVSLDFVKQGYNAEDTNEKIEYIYGNNNSKSNVTITCNNVKYVTVDNDATNNNATSATAIAPRTTKAVGHQYKYDAATKTYALRYVFGVSDLNAIDKALGFDATIKFADGTTKTMTAYCPTIYTSINGGGTVYNASDATIDVDYLFTLTIEGIPADQIVVEGTEAYLKDAVLEVTSFTSYNEIAKLAGASVTVAK